MRPGGNPDLIKFQYKCKIASSKGDTLSIKVAPGIKEKLYEKFGKEYTDKLRQAINELLED